MKIAIADMAYNWRCKAVFVRIATRIRQAFGEPRDRDADICDDGARAGPQAETRIERVIAGMPEPAAVFRRLGPFKAAAAKFGGNRLC